MASPAAAPPPALLADTLDPASAHAQAQSPLFGALPGEVRTRIFEHALAEHGDAARPYVPGSFHYRPGLEAAPRLSLALLRTCRRVYLEVGLLAAAGAELRYWWGRPPPDRPACGDPLPDLAAMAPARRALARVRVFAQQFHLEGDLRAYVLRHPRFRPAHLALTLRHGDWWYWETGARLALDAKVGGKPRAGMARAADEPFAVDSWGAAVGRIASLQTFRLELETVRAKRAELDAIIEIAKGWVFADPVAPADGRLVCDVAATRVSAWEGIDRFYELDNEQTAATSGSSDEDEPDDESDDGSWDGYDDSEDADDAGGHGSATDGDDGSEEVVHGSGTDGAVGDEESLHGTGEVAAGTSAEATTASEEPDAGPRKLDYHVVELTWKRRMT